MLTGDDIAGETNERAPCAAFRSGEMRFGGRSRPLEEARRNEQARVMPAPRVAAAGLLHSRISTIDAACTLTGSAGDGRYCLLTRQKCVLLSRYRSESPPMDDQPSSSQTGGHFFAVQEFLLRVFLIEALTEKRFALCGAIPGTKRSAISLKVSVWSELAADNRLVGSSSPPSPTTQSQPRFQLLCRVQNRRKLRQ
jgi:hypothetical protein